eukprot:g4272.t1
MERNTALARVLFVVLIQIAFIYSHAQTEKNPDWTEKYCASGQINRQGSLYCADCAPGYFSDTNVTWRKTDVCKACPQGYFNAERKFSNSKGMVKCDDCAKGKYSQAAASQECMRCSPGLYQDLRGQSKCHICSEVGKTPNSEQTACRDCQAGRFWKPATGLCYDCPSGFFNSLTGQAECQHCGLRTFSNPRAVTCTEQCACGYRCPRGAVEITIRGSGPSLAVNAAPTYPFDESQSTMMKCSDGIESSNPVYCTSKSVEPSMVPSGRYPGIRRDINASVMAVWSTSGTVAEHVYDTALRCRRGRRCPFGIEEECEPGWYADKEGMSECLPCPAGKWAAKHSSVMCNVCPSGFHCPIAAVQPLPCGCGRNASGVPKLSSPIRFNLPFSKCRRKDGARIQLIRVHGLEALDAYFEPLYAVDYASPPCTEADFNEKLILNVTDTCPEGWVLEHNSTFCPEGSGQQIFPAAGQFTFGGTDITRTSVSSCPKGTSCKDGVRHICLNGTFAEYPLSSICLKCPAGYFTDKDMQSACVACKKGRSSRDSGRGIRCDDCKAGEVAPYPHMTECRACYKGKYARTSGLQICTLCPAGYFQTSPGSSFCEACAEGMDTLGTAGWGVNMWNVSDADEYTLSGDTKVFRLESCRACPLGFYADSRATPLCTACQSHSTGCKNSADIGAGPGVKGNEIHACFGTQADYADDGTTKLCGKEALENFLETELKEGRRGYTSYISGYALYDDALAGFQKNRTWWPGRNCYQNDEGASTCKACLTGQVAIDEFSGTQGPLTRCMFNSKNREEAPRVTKPSIETEFWDVQALRVKLLHRIKDVASGGKLLELTDDFGSVLPCDDATGDCGYCADASWWRTSRFKKPGYGFCKDGENWDTWSNENRKGTMFRRLVEGQIGVPWAIEGAPMDPCLSNMTEMDCCIAAGYEWEASDAETVMGYSPDSEIRTKCGDKTEKECCLAFGHTWIANQNRNVQYYRVMVAKDMEFTRSDIDDVYCTMINTYQRECWRLFESTAVQYVAKLSVNNPDITIYDNVFYTKVSPVMGARDAYFGDVSDGVATEDIAFDVQALVSDSKPRIPWKTTANCAPDVKYLETRRLKESYGELYWDANLRRDVNTDLADLYFDETGVKNNYRIVMDKAGKVVKDEFGKPKMEQYIKNPGPGNRVDIRDYMLWDCQPCPLGGYCIGPRHSHWRTMRNLFGYWRPIVAETKAVSFGNVSYGDDVVLTKRIGAIKFYKCPKPFTCLGAPNPDLVEREWFEQPCDREDRAWSTIVRDVEEQHRKARLRGEVTDVNISDPNIGRYSDRALMYAAQDRRELSRLQSIGAYEGTLDLPALSPYNEIGTGGGRWKGLPFDPLNNDPKGLPSAPCVEDTFADAKTKFERYILKAAADISIAEREYVTQSELFEGRTPGTLSAFGQEYLIALQAAYEDRENLAETDHFEGCAVGSHGMTCSLCSPGYFMMQTGCQICKPMDGNKTGELVAILLIALIIGVILFRTLKKYSFLIKDMTRNMKIFMSFLQMLGSIKSVYTMDFPPIMEKILLNLPIVNLDLGIMIGTPCIVAGDAFDSFIQDIMMIFSLMSIVLTAFMIGACRKKGYCPKFMGGRQEKVVKVKKKKLTLRDHGIGVLKDIKKGVESKAKGVQQSATKSAGHGRAGLSALVNADSRMAAAEAQKAAREAAAKAKTYVSTVWEFWYQNRVFIAQIALFFHNPMTVKTFNMFRCTDVDGTFYLSKDYRILCYEAYHNRITAFVFAVAVIYPIGLPLGIMFMLFRARKLLKTPAYKKKWGFLYAPYRPHSFFFEGVFISRKLLLCGMMIMLYQSPVMQVTVAIIISTIFQHLTSHFAPFGNNEANMLQHVVLMAGTLNFMCAIAMMAMKYSPTGGEKKQGVYVGYFMLFVNAFTCLFFAIGLFFSLRVTWKKAQVLRRTDDLFADEDQWVDMDENTARRKTLMENRGKSGKKKRLSIAGMLGGGGGKKSGAATKVGPSKVSDKDGANSKDDHKPKRKKSVFGLFGAKKVETEKEELSGIAALPKHLQRRIERRRTMQMQKSSRMLDLAGGAADADASFGAKKWGPPDGKSDDMVRRSNSLQNLSTTADMRAKRSSFRPQRRRSTFAKASGASPLSSPSSASIPQRRNSAMGLSSSSSSALTRPRSLSPPKGDKPKPPLSPPISPKNVPTIGDIVIRIQDHFEIKEEAQTMKDAFIRASQDGNSKKLAFDEFSAAMESIGNNCEIDLTMRNIGTLWDDMADGDRSAMVSWSTFKKHMKKAAKAAKKEAKKKRRATVAASGGAKSSAQSAHSMYRHSIISQRRKSILESAGHGSLEDYFDTHAFGDSVLASSKEKKKRKSVLIRDGPALHTDTMEEI